MATRREFLEGIGGAAILGGYPAATARLIEGSARREPDPVLPRALEPGMKVGLVAPSSHLFDPERYRMAEDVVRSLRLEPVLAPHARDQRGYLAGADADRAADLNRFFADDGIDAIWCVRGGYGALRLLRLLDFEAIKAHPKVFIGYSDITALHAAIRKLTGLVTFHGPMPSSNLGAYAVDELLKVVGRKEPAGRVGAPPPFEAVPGAIDRANRLVTIAPGKARGRLAGGNLTLVCRLLGTPFEPELAGRILFLEDVGESAYRIDGLLSQLRLSGKLGACAGIAFGRFTEDVSPSDQPMRLPVETVLRDLTEDLKIPVLSGLCIGHIPDQTTLPLGVEAELDAGEGTLTLLEPAVS